MTAQTSWCTHGCVYKACKRRLLQLVQCSHLDWIHKSAASPVARLNSASLLNSLNSYNLPLSHSSTRFVDEPRSEAHIHNHQEWKYQGDPTGSTWLKVTSPVHTVCCWWPWQTPSEAREIKLSKVSWGSPIRCHIWPPLITPVTMHRDRPNRYLYHQMVACECLSLIGWSR